VCDLVVEGADRFYDNIEQMVGRRINLCLKICWRYLTPLITAVSRKRLEFGTFQFAYV